MGRAPLARAIPEARVGPSPKQPPLGHRCGGGEVRGAATAPPKRRRRAGPAGQGPPGRAVRAASGCFPRRTSRPESSPIMRLGVGHQDGEEQVEDNEVADHDDKDDKDAADLPRSTIPTPTSLSPW